jgi:hypothetical protein
MRLRWLWLTLAAGVLAGCAGYTDKTSPCVCDWTPIGDGTVPV